MAASPRGAAATQAAARRLYAMAKDSVNKTWDNPRQLLGPVLYRALIGEELLRLCARQDESIPAEAVRAMGSWFWEWLCHDEEVNGNG